MWPVLATVTPNRADWSVSDASFGDGAFGVQLNTYDDASNIYQNVLLYDAKGKIGVGPGGARTVKCVWLGCVVSPKNELLWITQESVPVDLLRGPRSKVELSFAERDENGLYGGQCNVWDDLSKPAVYSTAFIYPKSLQPTSKAAGFGPCGFGNGSSAKFANASFHLWLGEFGVRTPFLTGGVGSGEASNLLCSSAEQLPWMVSGAQVHGDFSSDSVA